MTTPINTTDDARLTRILGFLAQDPANRLLLHEALELTFASGSLPHASTLVAHIEKYLIEEAETWPHLAHLQLLVRNFPAASHYGDKAIQAGMAHPAVLLNTAYGHFYRGNPMRSAAILDTLTASDDAPIETLILHARARHHLAIPDQAEALVMRGLQHEPEHLEAKGLLALLLHERDENDRALQLAHEVLAHDPRQLDALIACGSVHVDTGNMERARKTWEHAVACHPTCGRAWSGLAQTEFHALEFAAAEAHLRQAVSLMPDHIGTWHLLAWLFILQDNSRQARWALEQSLMLDRNFGETHGGLAVVDVLDGQLEDARRGIRRALKLNQAGMSARYAEMLLLQQAGKQEEASRLVRQVLDRPVSGGRHSVQVLVMNWLKRHPGKTPPTPH